MLKLTNPPLTKLIKQLNNIYIHAGAVECQIRHINDMPWWKTQLEIYGMEKLYEMLKVSEQCGDFDWNHSQFMIDFDTEQIKSFDKKQDVIDWIGEENLKSMGVQL